MLLNQRIYHFYICTTSQCIAATGVIAGIVPGVFLSKINVIRALRKELIFNSGGLQRKLLLLFQFIIVATSLNLTFIINRQVKFLLNKDLGFNYENIVYLNLDKTLIRQERNIKKQSFKKSEYQKCFIFRRINRRRFCKIHKKDR